MRSKKIAARSPFLDKKVDVALDPQFSLDLGAPGDARAREEDGGAARAALLGSTVEDYSEMSGDPLTLGFRVNETVPRRGKFHDEPLLTSNAGKKTYDPPGGAPGDDAPLGVVGGRAPLGLEEGNDGEKDFDGDRFVLLDDGAGAEIDAAWEFGKEPRVGGGGRHVDALAPEEANAVAVSAHTRAVEVGYGGLRAAVRVRLNKFLVSTGGVLGAREDGERSAHADGVLERERTHFGGH